MSFYVGFVISDDCSENILDSFRDVYGISLEKIENISIKEQLKYNVQFYLLNDENIGYFWSNWTPIGRGQLLELWKNKLNEKIESFESIVASNWELEFNLRYTSFEAQMYILMIKYLKEICGVRKVGLVGTMINGECSEYQFPKFDIVDVRVKDLSPETLYHMKENSIYYFD